MEIYQEESSPIATRSTPPWHWPSESNSLTDIDDYEAGFRETELNTFKRVVSKSSHGRDQKRRSPKVMREWADGARNISTHLKVSGLLTREAR